MRSVSKSFFAGLLTCLLSGCAANTATTTAPTTGNGSTGSTTNVTVAVSPTATQVIDAGQTVALAATVTGDSSNRGVTWTVTTGGGTLSSTTGSTVTYTAPAAAATAVTVTAASVLDPTKSASATITVNALPAFAATGQLPQGYAGLPYTTTLTATGGTGTRTFSVPGGSTLPAGITLNPATGVLSGTPAAKGSTTFHIAVQDSATTPVTATASFTLGVSALQIDPPALVNTIVGRAYPTLAYASEFAQGAVTYRIGAGSLPAGLTLSSTGVLSGTPTAAGTSNYTVTATDAVGQVASLAQSIVVAPVLTLSGATLPQVTVGSAIAPYTFAATGGTAPYTYAVGAGSVLPAGLTLSPAGVLSGTPTTAAAYSFTVTVTDSGPGASLQSVTVADTLSVTVPPLAIATTTLSSGVPGVPYQQRISATGGVGPYSFSIAGGSLPSGVQLSAQGVFSGKPAATGSSTFTVQVTDAEAPSQTATQALTLTIGSALTPGVRNGALKGNYAFILTGQTNGAFLSGNTVAGAVYGADMAGSLIFDGSSLLIGIIDTNSARFGSSQQIFVNGSYAVDADGRGQVALQYGTSVTVFDIALSGISSGVATKFRLIEADADNPSNPDQVQGSGEALLQTPSAFNLASLKGNYVFRLNGESSANTAPFGALSAAGYLTFNGAGVITRGVQDASAFNTSYQQTSMTGLYSAPDGVGRGLLELQYLDPIYPSAPAQYIYYVVGPQQILLLSLNSHKQGGALMAGAAYQQQQALYSTTSLTGTLITAGNAVSGGDGIGTFPSTQSAVLRVLQVTSNGQMAGYEVSNRGGTVKTGEASPDAITYTVSDAGRVVLTSGSASYPVLWLYDLNQGVGTSLASTSSGEIGTVSLQAQTATTGSNTAYGIGTSASVLPSVFTSGILTGLANTTGAVNLDTSSNGVLTPGTLTGTTNSTLPTGRFGMTGNGLLYYGLVVSPSKIYFFNALTGLTQSVLYVGEQ